MVFNLGNQFHKITNLLQYFFSLEIQINLKLYKREFYSELNSVNVTAYILPKVCSQVWQIVNVVALIIYIYAPSPIHVLFTLEIYFQGNKVNIALNICKKKINQKYIFLAEPEARLKDEFLPNDRDHYH